MNSVDFTNLAAVIAIVALVSPIITAIVENLFKIKFKNMEYEHLRKTERNDIVKRVFENYLRSTGGVIHQSNSETLREYGSAYGLILTHVSKEEADQLVLLNNLIRYKSWEKADELFAKVAELIKDRLLTLYK